MSDSKRRLTIAPEFASLGRLASILKPGAGNATSDDKRQQPALSSDQSAWTVFGVGAIWQTAAENAARRSGDALGDWLSEAIREAALSQGVLLSADGAAR